MAYYDMLGGLDLIASDADDYVRRAVRIATDEKLRAELKARVHEALPRYHREEAVVEWSKLLRRLALGGGEGGEEGGVTDGDDDPVVGSPGGGRPGDTCDARRARRRRLSVRDGNGRPCSLVPCIWRRFLGRVARTGSIHTSAEVGTVHGAYARKALCVLGVVCLCRTRVQGEVRVGSVVHYCTLSE